MATSQPKSLLFCSAIQAAHYLSKEKRIKLDSSVLPTPLIEEVACQLKGINLAEFISSNQSLLMLKESFSVSGFQKLLFHFFKEIQSCEFQSTHKLFLQQFEDFKLAFSNYKLVHITSKNATQHFINVFDPNVAALGLHFFQLHVEHLHEFKFYQTKFERIMLYEKYPVPNIPPKYACYLPITINKEDYFPDVEELPPVVIELPLTPQDTFFCLLTGMAEAFRFNRHPETLAYALQLINIPEQSYSSRYYLHIYGMLAATLAKLHVDLSWSTACIEKTGQYLDLFSQQITALHYHQQFYAASNQYLEQEILFYHLLDLVPLSSSFYNQIVQIHLCCFFKELEISFMQILCMINDNINRIENHPKKITLQQRIKKHIVKQKKLLHLLLSQNNRNEDEIIFFFDLFHLYELLFDKLCQPNLETLDQRIEMLAIRFENHFHHADYFLRYESKTRVFDYQDYQSYMEDERQKIQLHMHLRQPELWADIAFSHFLFMLIISENHVAARYMLEEAKEIYIKLNNPKHILCSLFLNKQSKFVRPSFDIDVIDFSVELLLSSNPKIAELVQLGVLSVQIFNSFH